MTTSSERRGPSFAEIAELGQLSTLGLGNEVDKALAPILARMDEWCAGVPSGRILAVVRPVRPYGLNTLVDPQPNPEEALIAAETAAESRSRRVARGRHLSDAASVILPALQEEFELLPGVAKGVLTAGWSDVHGVTIVKISELLRWPVVALRVAKCGALKLYPCGGPDQKRICINRPNCAHSLAPHVRRYLVMRTALRILRKGGL